MNKRESTKIRPLRVRQRKHDRLGQRWLWRCRICRATNYWSYDNHAEAIAVALHHLRTHTPELRDATGMVAMFGPVAVWCPLCDRRIANGIAEDEARHVASEHWNWHLEELGRAL